MRDAERIAGGTLLFGPGERLNRLLVLVRATSPDLRPRQIADLDEIAGKRTDGGLLLVDADLLPAEDVGYLRRFLARNEGFQITLVGEDPSRRVARSLLRLARVQWLGWPPDIEDLQAFAGAPVAQGAPKRAPPFPEPARRPAVESELPAPMAEEEVEEAKPVPSQAPSHAHAHSGEDELDRIEAILELPEPPEDEEPAAEDDVPARAGTAPAGIAAPPPYFREQVADLADLVQRIEGGLATLRERGGESVPAEGESVDALSSDVARLVQFTRTLSYLSAAPPRGDQRFDLSELVETLVSGLPKKGPASPRWLVRSSGPLTVHSDRELLLQVFDALLYVAEKCSSRSDIVRVQATQSATEDAGRGRVTIEFAAGPLAGVDPRQVLEPYGLRRILSDLGPNALSAALGIVHGQGGSLELASPARGRLAWVLELPVVPGPAGAAVSGGSTPPTAERRPRPARGAADPFA